MSGAMAGGPLRRSPDPRTGKDAPAFPGKGGKPLSDMTISKIMRDMEVPFTVHGFRSTFKDWAVECTGFPDAVSEAALPHLDTNRVCAAYRRTHFLKLRTDLMAAWGAFVSCPSSGHLARLAA